jgi:hypothetical protein
MQLDLKYSKHALERASGPVVGAGLPILAIGYGIYWLVERRRKRDLASESDSIYPPSRSLAPIISPTLRAFAAIVKAGLVPPLLGMKEPSTT